ncbi:MAG: ABC transporter substrate-binding protein [Thermoplasmata archaeon]
MEASEKAETPEPTPETLPTEVSEEKPKKTKLLAVIVVVVLIVAAIAAAWGLGLFGGEAGNNAPTAGATASATTIDIGGTVTFTSTATDPDNDIVDYIWYFGDGQMVNGSDKSVVDHTYNYGGKYLVWHAVKDSKGNTASNEATMIRITVNFYEPAAPYSNSTAPYAWINVTNDIINKSDISIVDLSESYGVYWNGSAWIDHTTDNVTAATLDYGDGSDVEDADIAGGMQHKYTTAGHFAMKFTLNNSNNGSAETSTTVMWTVHVKAETVPLEPVKNPDVFVTATIGEPDFLDPAVDYETAGGEILQNVYETLVWYDGASAKDLIPLLAKEIPTIANGLVTPDGLNYTFNLRTGIKFHDGTTMNASDVVYSIQRVLRIHDPDGPSWMLEQIMTDYLSYYIGDELQNFSSVQWVMDAIGHDPATEPHYVIGEIDVQHVAEAAVIKVNDTAVRFRLTHPYPGFIYIAAYTVMDIVSMEYVEAHGGIVNGEHNLHMDENTCGTGPYKLVSWESGTLHMTRFADYHGAAPDIKDVYIKTVDDVNTRILMFQKGEADSIALPIEYEGLFTGNPNYRIDKGKPTFDIMFIGFNFNINTTAASAFGSTVPANFFNDIHVRRAFVHMFNYDQFLANVLKGNAIQPNGPIPKGMFGYNESIPKYSYSLTIAENEFKAAINTATGNSWWDDGFTVALFYNAGNTYREQACVYMKQALETLNPGKFSATINALDWPTYLANLRKSPSPFPMFWLGWAPDYADPDDYATPFLDSDYGTFPYRTGYHNDTINALIRAAAGELNETLRYQLYSQMSMKVYEDVPYIWLYQANNFHIERSWISGYYFNPMYAGFYYPQFTK